MSDVSTGAIPQYSELIVATFKALKVLGGSGKNNEINSKVHEIMNLSDEILSMPHKDTGLSEIDYRIAWSRTLLKNYGAIENSSRAVWSIKTKYYDIDTVDGELIAKEFRNVKVDKSNTTPENEIDILDEQLEDSNIEMPDEVRPWRKKLHEILINMDPYAFERLSQRLLRECGFEDVKVTKKSKDGGIDGTGKIKLNGIFSFNVVFQCKRYKGVVGATEIRNFRGSMTTDIEKGVLITTGYFSKDAILEASTPGKQRIDLIDGENFISKLAEYSIGVYEIVDYEIDEKYFNHI